nr:hypothetical protein [Pseudomonas composti]
MFVRTVVGLGGCGQGAGIHLVAAGDDVELLRVQLGVDLRAAGDQVELVDIASVEALTLDGDLSAVDVETLQAAVLDDRRAGAKGDARGVDEAAAIAGDAVRVGDDDRRRAPGHFRVAPELAGVATGDFVEDQPGSAVLQVRVADHVAAQLGLAQGLIAIIEDQALLADVVVGELVVRQAAAVRGGDVDHRYTVLRLGHGSVAACGLVNRQLRRRGDDGVEKQHAGNDEGDVLKQRTAYVHVDTPTSQPAG